ncbi:hypothetical protein [Pseudalkalibacillus salsuginis]|uniref:hypothetical protein n=1 Tax=Pseudalkalibacillus salsuginis TaxID=2910972 RepID=UPI001F426207|nr:hypothetical protein [Pseudalkalibacillus salsuginis]MCF6410693.1 hypothetical protein [Pseudalkalibacillus salsuginis]
MNVGKQLLLALSIYVVSAVIIEGVLWYFNPSLNEFVRPSIITSPVLISFVLTRIIVGSKKG